MRLMPSVMQTDGGETHSAGVTFFSSSLAKTALLVFFIVPSLLVKYQNGGWGEGVGGRGKGDDLAC